MTLDHPITLKSLHEQVYDYLKTQLKQGTLSGEGFLDLGALAKTLGVSRTPLRDALLQLEVEGFVTIVPRKGVLVRTLDAKDIQEIYQMVGALEASALLAAAPGLSPSDYALLRSLNAQGAVSAEKGDSDGAYKANFAFHDLFLDRCGNKRITTSVHTLKQQLYDWNRKLVNLDQDWESKNLQEHQDIVDCLERGEAGRAAVLLREVHWSYEVQEAFVKKVYFQG